MSVDSYSINHIDTTINIQGWSCFRFTSIYGEPNKARRRLTQNLIGRLARNNLSWCIIRDLNIVLGQVDKRGAHMYLSWLIQSFRDVLDDCWLSNMEMIGYHYTWEMGRGTDKRVEIRLDRALVSKEWTENFQEAKLTNLEVSASDHYPILLEPMVEKIIVRTRRFRFENTCT